jgi:ferredoxin-nitrite reductase
MSEQEAQARAAFDGYGRLKAQAGGQRYPKPFGNFRWRFGLFHVARTRLLHVPAADAGPHPHWQFAGVADLACGGAAAHVTTRANLQVREVEAKNAVALVGRSGPAPPTRIRADNNRTSLHADRGHDPQGADRHAALAREWAFPHPQ